MLVGLVSDSYDDMEALARAVRLFNGRGVERVVHAGDFCSPFTSEALGMLKCGFAGIFGNNDGDRLLLTEKFKGAVRSQPYVTTLGDRKSVIVHEPVLVDALADSGAFDLVLFGHTHKASVRRQGGTLVVNPGKVARLHRGPSTAAILDTGTMKVEIQHLFDGGP
jgi:putative phosphoesterase